VTTENTPAPINLAQLRAQLSAARKEFVPAKRSTVADRKAEIRKALGTGGDTLEEFRKAMTDYIDLVMTYIGDEVELNEHHAHTVMRQKLATNRLEEFLDVVDEGIKKVVFDSMNATNAEDPKVDDPVNVNSKLPVPSLGMEFSREGAGVSHQVDDEELQEVLTNAGIDWKSVYNSTPIPATVMYTLNTAALWAAIKDNADLKQEVGGLITEVPKKARLNTRNISQKSK
jgi:hypothetical protein